MISRIILGLVLCTVLAGTEAARAVTVHTWEVGSTAGFARGTLDDVEIDGEGRLKLAPEFRTLWGPNEGLVWSVASDGGGGGFVGCSAPTRVVHVASDGQATTWYAGAEDELVTAVAADGEGGVWVGISPSGKLLRLAGPDRVKTTVELGAEFVWALLQATDGGLWIGTGLPGRVLRRAANGAVDTVFESPDDIVRSLAPLGDGQVIAGTGVQGLVVRIGADGRPFVLLDAEETEIVSVATAADGSLLALAAGRPAPSAPPARVKAPEPKADVNVKVTAAPDDGANEPPREDTAARPSPQPRPPRTSPGAVLYRLGPEGDVWKIWQSTTEVPYAVIFDRDGFPVVATGMQGRVLRMDRRGQAIRVMRFPSDIVSAVSRTPDGGLLLGGSDDARLALVGPRISERGTFLTAPLDAGAVAEWGRLRWDATSPQGTRVRASVRVGNTAEPDETWSDWIRVADERVEAPVARWLQVRLELDRSRQQQSPLVRALRLQYRPRNRPPRIRSVTLEPPGVAWTRAPQQSSLGRGPVVTDDVVSRAAAEQLRPARRGPGVIRKAYEKGARTLAWEAADPDADSLSFAVAIRREGEQKWFLLAEGLRDTFYSWDSRSMPDGRYRARLTAEDGSSNPPGEGYQASFVSDVFTVDGTPPAVTDVDIREAAAALEVRLTARDSGGQIAVVEYALGAGPWRVVDPVDGVADAEVERYQIRIERPETPAHLRIRATDISGNVGGALRALDAR